MKKQPLDYFRNDSWPIRLVVLVFVRLTWLAAFIAVEPRLMKVLQKVLD